jgi:hypothetical protein
VRVPEPLFVVINPMMRLLLRSPLHFLVSKSLMVIALTGRKSKRTYTITVRYLRVDGVIRCFTSKDTRWWPNLRGGAVVSLRIAGQEGRYQAVAIDEDAPRIRDALEHYLTLFPGDAAYHEVRLNRDESLVTEDLERASRHAVVVEARPQGTVTLS